LLCPDNIECNLSEDALRAGWSQTMRMDPSRRDQSLRLHLLVACVAMFFLLIVLAASPGLAQEGSRLEKIEVVGLKRLTQEQAVTSSGLQVGQTVDRQILQAAVEKMLKSRLYSSVGYRVSSEDDRPRLPLKGGYRTDRTPDL